MKLKKGDTVVVIAGKDKGREGEVMTVLPKADKVIVSGVNLARKHQKARKQNEQGGIIDKDMPIPVSNVAVISPSDGKPTRIGYRFDDAGQKIRVARSTGKDL